MIQGEIEMRPISLLHKGTEAHSWNCGTAPDAIFPQNRRTSRAMIDTRPFFRPLSREMVDLLRGLDDSDWGRPTSAGSWRVRDVAAHLVDTALRRLSFHRDRLTPPSPETGQDFVTFINTLNARWVRTAERLSPRVLTGLYRDAGRELADFVETLDLDGTAVFPVSWAGQTTSPQWLDTGREFTEVWHHGSQIREAVGAGPWPDARWLHAVLQIAMLACPPAYADVPGLPGASVVITVTGRARGVWTLRWRGDRWEIDEGDVADPTTTVTMPDEVAWRLLFNGLTPTEARALVRVDGDTTLALPLLRARAVIVCPSS